MVADFSKARENTALTVTLEGRLDTTTAPLLEAELKDTSPGVGALTIDIHRLEYISSAGLSVLLSAQNVMYKQGEMKITGVNDAIMEILEVTGFSDILNIV
ncbi:MAG: STAS domain-containing protein [Oscillospiraceae bacterium]|nr:STAS domain-containing protein [Oscillospiraceae bacterium]